MVNLFGCYHGAKWTASHDAISNVFTFVMKNARFHVVHEQIHVFLQLSLQSYCQQVDMMSSIDDIYTLANAVIANPIQIDLVSCVTSFRKAVSIVVIQEKNGLSNNWHSMKKFIPLVIQVLGCLH
jgi:hypothetical protein